MDEKKAWFEIEKILSDTEGKYWGKIRDHLKNPIRTLSNNLSLEQFERYISKFDDYKSDEKYYYYAFGYSILSCVLKKWADEDWAEEGYIHLLEIFAKVKEENDRAIALVGNYYWPGIIEGFPLESKLTWIRDLYDECTKIIDSIQDEHMRATALSRLAIGLNKTGQMPWTRPFFESLVERSLTLKEGKDRAEALSGIIRHLGEWPEALWAVEMIENLLNKTDEFSEKPPDMWEDSPRTAFLKGIIEAIGEAGDALWIQKIVQELWTKVNTISDEQEKSKLFEDLAEAGLQSGSSQLREKILSKMFKEIAAIKGQDARAEAIGRMASGMVEEKIQKEVPDLFDRLIKLARKIKSEEARAKALADPVYSIGQALAEISDQGWAREKLKSLLKIAPSFKTREVLSEYLGYLVEVLRKAEKPEWAFEHCKEIIKTAKGIKKDEPRAEALINIAYGLSQTSGVSWQETLFLQLMDAACDIEEGEDQAYAIFSSEGIVKNALALDPQPRWAGNMMRKALSVLRNLESVTYKTLAIKEFGESILPEIKDEESISYVVNSLLEESKKLEEEDHLSNAIGGIATGIAQVKVADFKKDLLLRLIKVPRSFSSDRMLTLVTASIIEGAFEMVHDIREEPWIKEAFNELLETAGTAKDDEYKAGLLAGPTLQVRESIAQGLADVANSDWQDYYHKCLDFIDQFKDPVARFYAFINFAEVGIGEQTISEGLRKSSWLKEFLLMSIDKILSDLPKGGAELPEEYLKDIHTNLAKMLAFVDRRVEAERPEIISVFRNRPVLYESLISHTLTLSENVYTEKDPFTEDIAFEISPRTALLCTLARDFMRDRDQQWVRVFFKKILSVLQTLTESSNRNDVLYAIMEGTSRFEGFKQEIDWLEQILSHTRPSDTAHKGIRLSVMRAFIRLGDHDRAMKIALVFSDPVARIEAIRELSAILETELPQELQETLKELTTAESQLAITKRLLKDPDYKDENPNQYEYDVALSFAGSDRIHAARLVSAMEKIGLTVFYDKNYEADLWGENLYQKLYSIYSSQALYCLILISKHYTERKWTLHELEAAQSRQLESKEAYILPLRIDDTELPGNVLNIRGYLDLKEHSYDDTARILATKVKRRRGN